jgi:hypothetical protein
MPRASFEGLRARVAGWNKERLLRAALITVLTELTLFNGYQVWRAFPRKLVETDFRIWYAAATIGPHSGWSHLYDTAYQMAAVEAVWPGSRYLVFANPPVAAWIVLPFTLLPFTAALALWTVLSLTVLVGVSQAFSSGQPASRAVYALSVLGFLPTFVMVEAAPLSPIVFGAIGACALLLIRRHELAAGAVLSLLMVKFNLALLVPLALLAAGWWRTFAAWLVTSAGLGLISIAATGQQGVLQFIQLNTDYLTDTYHLNYSLATLLGSPTAWAAAAVATVAVTLATAWWHRGKGPQGPIAAGIVGTLLINHHLTPADFTILLIAVWLVLDARPRPWLRVLAVGLWAAGWTSSLGLAWPVAVMEALLLLGLLIDALAVSVRNPREPEKAVLRAAS